MRILIATGGAAHSDAAVHLGAYLARLTAAPVTFLTVIRHEHDRAQAEAILARATALTASYGLRSEQRIRVGNPAEQIIGEAREGAYGLLVVGERSTHGLATRLLGPTPERVIEALPCPVLLARLKTGPVEHILVCESGREPSLLSRLISKQGPLLHQVQTVTVLHVMSQIAAMPGVPGWELEADAAALIRRHSREGDLLEQDLARLAPFSLEVTAKVRHGLVVDEILAEAAEETYDLLVIGAHESRGWQKFLLDDLARQIIHEVPLPVLIL